LPSIRAALSTFAAKTASFGGAVEPTNPAPRLFSFASFFPAVDFAEKVLSKTFRLLALPVVPAVERKLLRLPVWA
jgi:hypothetical protein